MDSDMLRWKLDNARFTIRADEMALRTVKSFVKDVSGSFIVDITLIPTTLLEKPSFDIRINLSCVSSPVFHMSDIDNSPSPSTDDADDVKRPQDSGDDCKQTAEFCLRLEADESDKQKRKRTDVNTSGPSEGEPSAKRRKTEDDEVVSTERSINEVICACLLQGFVDSVVKKLNGALPVDSLPTDASDEWLFNFSQMSMPEFQNGFLVSKHLSAFRYQEATIEAPTPVRIDIFFF